MLNWHKSKEIIVTLTRHSTWTINLLLCSTGIEQVTSLKMLDVTITDKLCMSEYGQNVVATVTACHQSADLW